MNMKPPTEIDSERVAGCPPRPCSPLIGRRVIARDGTRGAIMEVGKTPRWKITVFHVRADDGEREAALRADEFEFEKRCGCGARLSNPIYATCYSCWVSELGDEANDQGQAPAGDNT